ncbi:MAG: polymer-forming cytoskeletal protein [Clostridia bacterium]|nr:polymer-forming cytoskeletal protein [Clostridia bacterium]
MSFFSKKITEPEPVAQEPAATAEPELAFEEIIAEEPAIPEAKYPENLTVIGAGTVFEGNITSSDDIEINGTVRGDIASSADMKINGTGFYFGAANMANLNVDGRAEGDIDCGGHTVLTNTGYVKGSITSSRLTTAEGAVIDGVMSLNSKPKKEEKPAPQVVFEEADEEIPAEE